MVDVFLYPGESSATDVRLRDPLTPSGGGSFPTQYLGLRAFFWGAVQDLCLVALGDAPTGMGARITVDKGGTSYAAYLVDTTDTYASPVRVQTSTGIKAIRLKT